VARVRPPGGDGLSSKRSISFDRAAEVYDETRRLTPGASAATTELLTAEMGDRGPCLEIGVGTGLIGLPLAATGVRLVGLDLSRPMLVKLAEKAGGRPPFPLVVGDATRLPFHDAAFGGALARHVLHLIPIWRTAVAELVRVVAPGGVLLINLGFDEGPWKEIGDHMDDQVGRLGHRVVGLDFDDGPELDDALAELDASARDLPAIWQESELTLDRYFAHIEARAFSWTWRVDPERLSAAVDETKSWAAERFGSFDQVIEPRFKSIWRAYDLP
jgi:ubiquinone/menaquinone biosynthesis C-methylase UbiE